MRNRRHVIAIVLAGGRSSRFGSDKLVADFGGRSLLAATLHAVAPVVEAIVVAGPALPPEVGGRIGRVPIALAPDRESFGGPLAALARVLDQPAATADALVLVVGGDMPGVVPDVLELMIDRLADQSDVDAVVLDRPPRLQTLPLAIWRQAGSEAAAAAMDSGNRSLVSLLDRLRVEAVPAAEWTALDPAEATLQDVDRPDDLSRIRN